MTSTQRYVCTACLTPASSLYKGNAPNVQLTKCLSCSSVVDRFVEYEPLLVVVKALIQRPQVYRHVVLNRYAEEKVGVKEVVKVFASLALLDGYLSYQASPTAVTLWHFWAHCAGALTSNALFVGSVVLAGAAALGGFTGQVVKGMFLAVVLPSAAKLVAVVLLIWAEEQVSI